MKIFKILMTDGSERIMSIIAPDTSVENEIAKWPDHDLVVSHEEINL